MVVDVRSPVVGRGDIDESGLRIEVGLTIVFLDRVCKQVPTQAEIQSQVLSYTVVVLNEESHEEHTDRWHGIDKIAVNLIRIPKQETCKRISGAGCAVVARVVSVKPEDS